MVYVEHTLRRFPIHPKMKDECALPFGMAVSPFAQMTEIPLARSPRMQAADVPRCSECLAYINCFSGLDSIGWRCSLCGSYNEYVKQESRRYSRSQMRDTLPELNDQVYEVMCPLPKPDADDEPGGGDTGPIGPFPVPREGRPVFIALVDTTGCSEYLELVKTGLAAALQALPPVALVGLITLSDQVGLWDVKAPLASVRQVPVFEDGRIMAPLEDAVPLRCLLAPLERCQASISAALELLQPTRGRARAFGAAMHAVLDYLVGLKEGVLPEPHQNQRDSFRHEAGMRFGPAQVACFLSGPPNMGLGKTIVDYVDEDFDTGMPRPSQAPVGAVGVGAENQQRQAHSAVMSAPTQMSMDPNFLEPEEKPARIDTASKKFYEQLAVVAAIEGVCIDLYAVGPRPCGLVCLAPLCEKTGGLVHYYAVADDAALPQDLYKRLQGPHAIAGLLRVRCCPELRIKQSYGRLFPDADHEQLYHLVSCDCKETLAFDLDFTSQSGFLSDGGNKVTHPVVQFAFQYSVLVGVAPEADGDAQDKATESAPIKYEMQRRMRITTVAPRLAKTHEVVFNNAQVDTVAKVLMHKVLQCQADEGPKEARKLLQDWFVIMCSRYHHLVGQIDYGATPHPGQIDVMLDKCEALAPMATLTYALLRSPLFGAARNQDSDLTTYLRLLWCSLPPSELQRVLYPLLISFRTPDDRAHDRHLLSRATLLNNNHPILLLDAFHVMLVMYRKNCPSTFPFPPPPESHLRESIQVIKKSRKISPKVKYCREGDADAALLDNFLIDEPQVDLISDDASEAASMGFAQWVLHVQNDIQKFIATQR